MPRSDQIENSKEERKMVGERGEMENSKINTLSEKKIKEKQISEEDGNIDVTVEYVGKSGDLSPRHIENIKGKIKKATKQAQPQSQINTRKKKGSSFTYE